MTTRFERAHADLAEWRTYRDAITAAKGPSAELTSVTRAVDASFKGEVLEWRIRESLRSQSVREAADANLQVHETDTGKHRWDFDWWLTEATMRSLHAGLDAAAQLLNLVQGLRVDPGSKQFPSLVAKELAARTYLKTLYASAVRLDKSAECRNLRAFVNHVKHAGFPKRRIQEAADGLDRVTSVERFRYEGDTYGPWSPRDLESIMDGFRAQLLEVFRESLAALQSD